MAAVEIDQHHRRHATCELAIRDLKDSGGLAHLPSGVFAANAAWLLCAALAHNLYRHIALLGGTHPPGRMVRGRTPGSRGRRNTNRLTQAGIEPSVGSVGDSYDNALAESVIGLYKTELIRQKGPWRNLDQVEYATLEYVDWFNHRRLLEPIGDIPPTEKETNYYRDQKRVQLAGLK